ncbi:ABC transporter ATP-binding protein [Roseomonas chloroacetimidivorans]|uniref:ABC transporter ATP-binding protein n=1 Tax=Roseomonas chloroacetimidivorans TaxID=1766656 RepID=UPI003C73750C
MTTILEVDRLSRRFGGLVAVREVSLTLGQGEILGIIGPNGAGKTTLFNMLAGAVAPSSGEVHLKGRRITGCPLDMVARLGMVKTFQTARLFGSMSFLENVVVAAFSRTRDTRHARAVAEEKLALVGLAEHRLNPARGASTGQRKRLEIARALAVEPHVLLLDEPFAGVDLSAINGLIDLLQRIRSSGVSILLIEHNLEAIRSLADRLIAMAMGRKIADGDPLAVTTDPRVVRAYLGDEIIDAA